MVQNHLKVSYQCHTMFLVPRPYRFRDMDAQILFKCSGWSNGGFEEHWTIG